jgi:opacity protein-like surface antigen
MLANDSTLLYALAGIGMDDGTNAYIVGLGAEYALTDSLTLRGQVYGGADLGATPDYVQGTLGVSWHFN